ncbi:hypothetical protein MOQ72_25795 [Saccharopolyspora sp. K220]|uniref:hypothetical protein n=1 Tax=Saccharopolyspora soli TaxID=2926618 RepID=UPI001F56839C|nr:hypothetical protein [Saccharopolyspora soli]MCI2420868.1 hypothetical protein [Saccharopolyspora soli]
MVADAELVLMPEEHPAGPAAVEIRLGGVIVGDVTFRVCRSCRLAVVEHVRVESPQRRRRLATLAINFLVSRWPDYRGRPMRNFVKAGSDVASTIHSYERDVR